MVVSPADTMQFISLTRGLSEGTGSPLVSLHNDLERRERRTEMSRAGKRFLTRRFLRLKILSCFHVLNKVFLATFVLFYSFPELRNYIHSNAHVTCSESVVGSRRQ